MEELENKSTKSDLKNLLSCILCHKESGKTTVIQEALKTVIDICTNTNNAKDIFREIGGLKYLLKFMCITDSVLLLEWAMRTLSSVADENVQNQTLLTCKEVFSTMHAIFIKKDIAPSALKNAILFISTVLYQNASAQDLMADTGCIYDLMNLYMSFFPQQILNNDVSKINRSETVFSSVEIWQAINRALCFSVNNPLNKRNQMICSYLFPMALKILESSSSIEVICPALLFLSLNVTNNAKNQDLLAKDGGLVTVKNCLQKNVDSIVSDMKNYNELINPTDLEATYGLIGVINSASLDNVRNSSLLGKLGALTNLVKLLNVKSIEVQWKTRIILTLGHCIDIYPKNKTYLLEEDTTEVLKSCMSIGEKDLTLACKYLLHVCLKTGSSQYNGVNDSCSAKTKMNGHEPSKNSTISSLKSTKRNFVKKRICDASRLKKKADVHNPQPIWDKTEFSDTSTLVNKANTSLGSNNKCNCQQINKKCLNSFCRIEKDPILDNSRNDAENYTEHLNYPRKPRSVISCMNESRSQCQCMHSHSMCRCNANSSFKGCLHCCTPQCQKSRNSKMGRSNTDSLSPDIFNFEKKRKLSTELSNLGVDDARNVMIHTQNSENPEVCGLLNDRSAGLPSCLKSEYLKMKEFVQRTSSLVENLNKSCSELMSNTNGEIPDNISQPLCHTGHCDVQVNNDTAKTTKSSCTLSNAKESNSGLHVLRKPTTFQLQSFQDSNDEILHHLNQLNENDGESDMLSISQVNRSVRHSNPLQSLDGNHLRKESIKKLNSQSMSSHEKICLWLSSTELCEAYSEFDLNMMNTAGHNELLRNKFESHDSVTSVDVVNCTMASRSLKRPLIPVSSDLKIKKGCNLIEYDNGQMPVIVFPGIKCSAHNLTTGLEMLQMQLL